MKEPEQTKPRFPRYTLETVTDIPDSLKAEHRQWIIDIVKAAHPNNNIEYVEGKAETITKAKQVADQIFGVRCFGIRVARNVWGTDDIIIKPSQMNAFEKQKLKELIEHLKKIK